MAKCSPYCLTRPEDESKSAQVERPQQEHPRNQPHDLPDQRSTNDGGKSAADQEKADHTADTGARRDHTEVEGATVMDDREDGVVHSAEWRCHVHHAEDLGHRVQRCVREPVQQAEKDRRVGVRPSQEEEGHSHLLAPQDPDAKNDGDGTGHEEGHRQEIDPVHPEHGRQLGREEEVGAQSADHERHADDVVGLAVMNCGFGLTRPTVHPRQDQRDERHEAHIGQGRIETGQLPEGGQGVAVRNDDYSNQGPHLHRRARPRLSFAP